MAAVELVSLTEAARRLGVHRFTVHRALAEGRLTPAIVAGRRVVKVDARFRTYVPAKPGRPLTKPVRP